VNSRWRLGASFNNNHTDVGDRQMQNNFCGRSHGAHRVARRGRLHRRRESPAEAQAMGRPHRGRLNLAKGHNLKLTADESIRRGHRRDEQVRYSLVWNTVPIQFAQAAARAILLRGIPQNDRQNRQLRLPAVSTATSSKPHATRRTVAPAKKNNQGRYAATTAQASGAHQSDDPGSRALAINRSSTAVLSYFGNFAVCLHISFTDGGHLPSSSSASAAAAAMSGSRDAPSSACCSSRSCRRTREPLPVAGAHYVQQP